MVKNIIEPIINIGIVLPEDKKTEIIIDIPNPSNYKINSKKCSDRLIVSCQSGSILINNKLADKYVIEPIDDSINNEFPIINSVPAGRGFHWQKEINVKLPGKIIIQNRIIFARSDND